MPKTNSTTVTERSLASERARLTPPQYRVSPYVSPSSADARSFPHAVPGRALEGDDVEVVVLRGRPVGTDGAWTTWQEVDLDTEVPADVVAWFTARLPQYEFAVVRAERVYAEERLA